MLALGDLTEGVGMVADALGPMEPKPREGVDVEAELPALTGGRGRPALAATETEEPCEAEPAGVKTAVEGRGGNPWGGAGKVEAALALPAREGDVAAITPGAALKDEPPAAMA